MKLKPNSVQIAALVIIITHLVGLVGFLSPWKDLFISLTPIHILLSTGLMIFHQEERPPAFWFLIIALALSGFFVEVAGIQTGVIFGAYAYDTALGPKIWGTPPLIGVNWLMLVLALGSIVARVNVPVLIKAMLGALAMVSLDYLIEPVAINFDFWHWERTTVPTHNYLGWLITAFIFFLAYFKTPFDKRNPLAPLLLMMQILFFGLLNIFV